MAEPKKVLIIGGGFTGLTAAYELSKEARHSITVIERSEQLGGLAGGFPLLGNSIEKTYHHLFRTDEAMIELVKELGLSEQLVWCDSSMGIYRDGRVYPFMTPWDLLRFRPCGMLGRLRVGLTALYLKRRQDWNGLVEQPAVAWMTRACGQEAMETIWTPLLKGKFERYYGSISMAWLWARIHARANTREAGSQEQLGYFKGGFATVIRRLESELVGRGVNIRTGVEVERFREGERAVGLKSGGKLTFDVCLFTGPSPAFAKFLPAHLQEGEYGRRLRSIEYLGAISLLFVTGQQISNCYWLNINEPDAPFLVFVNHSRLVDAGWYQGKRIYYIGAYKRLDSPLFSLDDEAVTKLWWDYLKKVFPEFEPGRVEERHVFRFQAAQHIVDMQYEKKIPEYMTPLPGVFLANFSQIFPHDRGTTWAVSEGIKIAGHLRTALQS